MNIYKNLIDDSFKNANNNISKITKYIIHMDGIIGTKTRHLYNNLLNTPDARYLDIGTWKGTSVCSAMYKNNATVVCIDNWVQFGCKFEFSVNFDIFKGKNRAIFIEKDCYQVDVSTLPKFNIYANHKNQINLLSHYYECLDDIFIIIVNDWNLKDVREGTMRYIQKLNLNVLYEREIRTTDDDTQPDRGSDALKEWYNGIYVAILQKP